MAVPVKAAAGTKPFPEPGAPVTLFDANMAPDPNNVSIEYGGTADGKRFPIYTTSGVHLSSDSKHLTFDVTASK